MFDLNEKAMDDHSFKVCICDKIVFICQILIARKLSVDGIERE